MTTDNTDNEATKAIDESVESEKAEFVVDPWNVSGVIDYNRLVDQFGTEYIDDELMERFTKVTGKELHPWMRRQIFFSHRKLGSILDAYERGEPIFLYTGRGPTSDSMHLGHVIPFIFTKYLQDVFDCPLVIQMADDEKFYFKPLDLATVKSLGLENAKDIVSFGFNPKKTFIFSNNEYRQNRETQFESFVTYMKKIVNLNQVKKVFGFDDTANVGMVDWPFYQSAAAFSQAFPHIFGNRVAHCLVAYAIDQDPYFRMARDVAEKMQLLKPCSIMCTFIPPLSGNSGKMSSSSGQESTLFLTDPPEEVERKVMKYAFSGGEDKAEDHRKLGGRPDEDMSYQYLRYLEFDDTKLQEIHDKFKSGEYLCYDLKKILIAKINELFSKQQAARAVVTDEVMDEFYVLKSMDLPKEVELPMSEAQSELMAQLEGMNIKTTTKYHTPITTMEQGRDIACQLVGAVCKNMLIKTKNGMVLYVTTADHIELKTVKESIGLTGKVRFSTLEEMMGFLKVPKGCATIFALVNIDPEKCRVVFDRDLEKEEFLNFHPLRNDATTTIKQSDLMSFADDLGFKVSYA
jgi:tryptophanyl-tRNA synthetase